MLRLNVRPQDNIALGDFALDMLKRAAAERRLHRPLDRAGVVFNLRKAGDAAELEALITACNPVPARRK